MFERYTERARRVLFFARYEASQLGSISIETEHLLLGLMREGKGLTSRIFARSHLSFENIRKEIEGRTVFRDKISTSVEIPFASDCKRALGYAAEEADRLLHDYIGTEHLLLGLLREERSVATSILMDKGMRLQTVRDDIVQLLNQQPTEDLGVHAEVAVERQTFYWPHAIAAQMLPQYLPSHVVHTTYSFSPPQQQPWVQHAGSAWRAYGHTLAQIIALAWRSHEGVVRLEGLSVDEATRYDFVIVLPATDSNDIIPELLRRSIEQEFGVQVTPEGPDPVALIVRPR